MKETTPAAMPPCFHKWCDRLNDLFRTKAQKREFRNYLGELLGESERKNLSQKERTALSVAIQRQNMFRLTCRTLHCHVFQIHVSMMQCPNFEVQALS